MSKKDSTKKSRVHAFLQGINKPKGPGRPKKHTPENLDTVQVVVITGLSPEDNMIYTLRYADDTVRTYRYGALDPRILWGAESYPVLACDARELAELYVNPEDTGQAAIGRTVCCIPLSFAKELLPETKFAPVA